MDENLSTLSYASKASCIANKPIKNEDPKTQQISELKRQVKLLTEELTNANETISFLSSITGQNPATIAKNLGRLGNNNGAGGACTCGAAGGANSASMGRGARGGTPTRGVDGAPGSRIGSGTRNIPSGGSGVGPNGKGL